MDRKQLQKLAQTLEGIPVWGCIPGSASERAGIRYGDILLEVNGMRTRSIPEYMEAKKLTEGAIAVKIFRNGRELDLSVEPDEEVDMEEAKKLVQQMAEGRLMAQASPRGQEVLN